MRLAIAVTLAFIAVAGGLTATVAVLAVVFDLVWETRLPGPQPDDGATPAGGHGPSPASRPAGQRGERR